MSEPVSRGLSTIAKARTLLDGYAKAAAYRRRRHDSVTKQGLKCPILIHDLCLICRPEFAPTAAAAGQFDPPAIAEALVEAEAAFQALMTEEMGAYAKARAWLTKHADERRERAGEER